MIPRCAVSGLLVALLFAACASEDRPERATEGSNFPGTYVGEVAGTQFFAAASTDGEKLLVYLCDGDTKGRWYRGTFDPRETKVSSSGGESGTLSLTSKEAKGSVTLDGKSYGLSLEPVTDGGLFRLERSLDEKLELSGWVVLNDGRGKGVTLVDGVGQKAAPLQVFSSARKPIITPCC